MLHIDNTEVLYKQCDKIKKIRAERDNAKAQVCSVSCSSLSSPTDKLSQEQLKKLEAAACDTKENLLTIAIECARTRCTVGEISMALENVSHCQRNNARAKVRSQVFGRYTATTQMVSGAYKNEYGEASEIDKAVEAVRAFAQEEGRQPRILVAKMGQDGHDRGAKVISTGFADLG